MSERPSAEQLAEIRRIYESFGNVEIIAVFRELDAVTHEKDGLFDSLTLVNQQLLDVTRERDKYKPFHDAWPADRIPPVALGGAS